MADPEMSLAAVERRFHDLIRCRAREFVGERVSELDLPPLRLELEVEEDSGLAWYPVDGMYGGFAYAWDPGRVGERLLVDSWCRVVGGSGQRHAVTADTTELLEAGFV